MSTRFLYKTSKRIYKEAVLDAQIHSAGSNQQRFLERIEKDKVARSPDIIYKILATIYIASLTAIPIVSVFTMYSQLANGVNIEWINFAGGVVIGIFFLFQMVILLVFALFFSWGIMSGGPYEWIHTLPFNRKQVEKLGFLTFARSINVQLIVMTLVLPVGIATAVSLSIGMFLGFWKVLSIVLITLVLSVSNTCFNLGLLVILGRKLAIVMEEYDIASRKANLIRILTMLSYILLSMFVVTAIQLGLQQLGPFFGLNGLSVNNSILLSDILSFIPYPFSGGYLLSMFILDFNGVSTITVLGSITGFILFCIITFFVTKKALSTLRNISSPEIKRKEFLKKKTTIDDIVTKKTTPIRAFFKRDLAIITREMQQIIVLILPIMIPVYAGIIGIFDPAIKMTLISIPSEIVDQLKHSIVYLRGYVSQYTIIGNTAVNIVFIILMVYVITNTIAMIISLTNIETGGETITASLPLNVRDQIKSKLPYFFGPIIIAMLLSLLIQIRMSIFLDSLYLNLAFIPVYPILGVSGLLLKITLFGRFRHKFVVEEIKTKNKFWKYLLCIVYLILVTALFIYAAVIGYWAIFTVEAVFTILTVFAFNMMFPKKEWKIKYIF